MTLPGLLASSARQNGDIQKNLILSFVYHMTIQLVIVLYLLHEENIE